MDIDKLCNKVRELARSVVPTKNEQEELKRKDIVMKERDYVTYADKTAEEMLVKGFVEPFPSPASLRREP